MTHMFKHFEGSGTGIRSLLDQYVYLNRLEDSLDFPYIDKQCEILGNIMADVKRCSYRNWWNCVREYGKFRSLCD